MGDLALPGNIYAHAFETARAGLLLLNRETGCIGDVNSAFLRISGQTRDALLGLSFWKPPLIAEPHVGAELHAHLRAGGVAENAQLPLESGDGRYLLLEISGSSYGDITHLEVRDVTGREQKRTNERLETMSRLAGHTAGELQSLLHTLQTMGELLMLNANRDRSMLRALQVVQQAGERAGSIAGQLLSFSGRAEFQLRRFDLNTLVEATLPELRQLFPRSVEIVSELNPNLEPAIADPPQMRRVLLELARNSAEAMGYVGCLSVRTDNVAASQVGLHSNGSCDTYAMLAISDNGPGLDDESWEHLFEPFSTTRMSAHGLGLAAVHGIVRQSGGKLWVHSEPDHGATFRIYLPAARSYFPALPPARIADFRGDATILLVEADDSLRTVIANLLKKRGYRVLSALDSQEALRIMGVQGPPDLLIGQPEPELTGQLMGVQPRFRILCLEGYSTGGQTHGLPPWSSVVRKPLEPEALLSAVHQLLGQPL